MHRLLAINGGQGTVAWGKGKIEWGGEGLETLARGINQIYIGLLGVERGGGNVGLRKEGTRAVAGKKKKRLGLLVESGKF